MPIRGIVRAVNLLPPDMRGASKATAELGAGREVTGGAGAFVVLGVLAACVAGAAGYVLTNNTITQRQSDLTEVQARQQAIAAKAAALRPFADFRAIANQRVETVRDIAGSRFDWEQVLRDLSRAIPQDVTLKSLTGDISSGAGGAGGSSSGLRTAISAPAITIQGCAPGQTQVARLMARLHNVDGVTRVSLSKSDTSKVEDNGGQTSSVERRNAAPCGIGKRPAFELVVFFEKAAAAVAATPTTASGSITPSTPSAGATATATPSASSTPSAGTTTSTASTSPQGGAAP